jgi:1-acyl-sn-glycerol-3-phosphate acyltransferase
MIKPKHNTIIKSFFSRYISWIVRRHFHAIEFDGPEFGGDKALLLVANHFSWWDGFLLYHYNKIRFKKAFHIMVLEETMQKFGFMKYIGAFSINKNSKDVIESLDYAAELLNDPDNLVVMFPQGKLYSNFVGEVKFESGLSRITEHAKADFEYMFAAVFVENFEHKKPTAYISLKSCSTSLIKTPQQVQAAYQEFYSASKLKQTRITV